MGKCFITKLPAEVNNDDLPIYGKFNINFKPLTSGTGKPRRGVSLAFDKDAELKIVGKGYFTNADKSQNLGAALSIKGDNAINSIYVSDEVSRISVDKYTLTYIKNYADSSDLSNPNSTVVNIQDLKYANLNSLYLTSTAATGDISSLSNLTNLNSLNLTKTAVTGDISSLSNLTNLNSLNLTSTAVTGDMNSISGLTKLTNIEIQNTYINNITVELINKFPLLTSCIIPSISGDIAQVHDGIPYIMVANYKVNKSFPVSWTAKSRQNKKLICFPSSSTTCLDFGTDLDNMLIDQATCNYTDIGNYYGVIRVKGTRTSASDAALASIQNKGVTVTILS